MRIRLDPFIIILMAAAVVASFIPAQDGWLDVLQVVAKLAIGLLFFLYGARLSTPEAIAGLKHWKLHAAILATTYLVFPLLGLTTQLLVPGTLSTSLYAGVLLLCLVPSTVQSSVAFTSIARGNVAGAVVSASLSNIIGIVLTPLLVTLLLQGNDGAVVDAHAVFMIVAQLLAPFVLGQLLRPWVGHWVSAHDHRLKFFDRASIVIIVYLAFSEGRNYDIWSTLDGVELSVLAALCVALLAIVLAWTTVLGKVLSFDRGDRLALLFCGSKKSLASGLPMATVMFAPEQVALVVLPLMVFHQIQLIVCAQIATRAARHAS